MMRIALFYDGGLINCNFDRNDNAISPNMEMSTGVAVGDGALSENVSAKDRESEIDKTKEQESNEGGKGR